MKHLAHISDLAKQTVDEHSCDTAAYAKESLSNIGLGKCAYLAGILHDLGKCTEQFEKYIETVTNPNISKENMPKRGSVNHTFAGVRYLLLNWESFIGEQNNIDVDISSSACESIAYAIGAHHGLFDCINSDGSNGYTHRLEKADILYDEAVENFHTECLNENEISKYAVSAYFEYEKFYEKLLLYGNFEERLQSDEDDVKLNQEMYFYQGVIVRLLTSAVIDADRRDTAEFMQGYKGIDNTTDWAELLNYMEGKLNELDSTTPINIARRALSDICRNKADGGRGLFRLNLPTGAGKTLDSLRFALAYSEKNRCKRIIFVSPLISIIEQNAEVIRRYIKYPEIILEHHSNVIKPKLENEELCEYELSIDSWNKPIIITTLVQLLNTMFSAETTCVRRFSSLTDAVIVIDEVQSVPSNMLSLFNLMVGFLSGVCNSSIILCSATQPNMEYAQRLLPVKAKELVQYDEVLWNAFRRTIIKDAGNRKLDEIPEFIEQIMENADNLLVICNRKDECEFLYNEMKRQYRCFHMSAGMCIEHRRDTMIEIRKCLHNQERFICISTQVIEAGVDISFHSVIRVLAGMDNVVQAAGRCNRNSELSGRANVYTINCTDENLKALSEIQGGKNASISLLNEYKNDSKRFRDDLSSDEAIAEYYRFLYHDMKQGFQDDYVKKLDNTVFSLLSDNEKNYEIAQSNSSESTEYSVVQAFKTAGTFFHVFDQDTVETIVPYGKGKEIITKLFSLKAKFDPNYIREILNEAKPYMVTLYSYQKEQIDKQGGLTKIDNEFEAWVLSDAFYDDNTGVTINKAETNYLGL